LLENIETVVEAKVNLVAGAIECIKFDTVLRSQPIFPALVLLPSLGSTMLPSRLHL